MELQIKNADLLGLLFTTADLPESNSKMDFMETSHSEKRHGSKHVLPIGRESGCLNSPSTHRVVEARRQLEDTAAASSEAPAPAGSLKGVTVTFTAAPLA